MVKAFIICAISFAIGNVLWDNFGFNDPRLFYIPLSALLFSSAWYVKKTSLKRSNYIIHFLDYIVLLAGGNVIKQVFYYNDTIQQINDYWWGSLISAWLIIILIREWVIQNQKNGGRA